MSASSAFGSSRPSLECIELRRVSHRAGLAVGGEPSGTTLVSALVTIAAGALKLIDARDDLDAFSGFTIERANPVADRRRGRRRAIMSTAHAARACKLAAWSRRGDAKDFILRFSRSTGSSEPVRALLQLVGDGLTAAERLVAQVGLQVRAAALALDPGIRERIEMAHKHPDEGGPSTSKDIAQELADRIRACG